MRAKYIRVVDNDWYRQRLSSTLVIVMFVFAMLLTRLFYLQILRGDDFRRQSENNYVRVMAMPAVRGAIFDRAGVLIADNRAAFSISFVREDTQEPKKVLSRLAQIMGKGPEFASEQYEIARRQPAFKAVLIQRDADRDLVAAVEARKLELPGVVIAVAPTRHYPGIENASHLIGYLSEINDRELRSGRYPLARAGDFIGKSGVEKAYESYFSGRRGTRCVQVDALGRSVQCLKTAEAVPGADVYLTIDYPLQTKTEELLQDKVGAAVAVDPNNGRVLAMVSKPSFDPNLFVEGIDRQEWSRLVTDEFKPLENKVIQGQYPPGSIYKLITAIAGLEEGQITPDTEFYCTGKYHFGNRDYRCWKRGGHGSVRLRKAIAQSCDVYFFRVGQSLGVNRLAKYAKSGGLGAPTGIGLGKEATGLIPTAEWKLRRFRVPWQRGETLSISIGQGFDLVTPMQMACLYAAVGNGGTLYRPHVVDRIVGYDGTRGFRSIPEVTGKLQASEKTLALVREGLVAVVNEPSGTAWVARLPNIVIAGKTGTAQVVGMKETGSKLAEKDIPFKYRDHAWFVSYAPADNPKIAVAVLVEHGGHGSSAAGPVAREMIRTYLMPETVPVPASVTGPDQASAIVPN